MGLDIYIHRTRHQMYEDDYREVINNTEEDAKIALASDYLKAVAELSRIPKSKKELYREKATEWLKKLAEHFSYPEFDLDVLGYGKAFQRYTEPQPDGEVDDEGNYRDKDGMVGKHVLVIDPAPIEVWIEKFKQILNFHYAKDDGYFRKVNLLFAFCENRGILLDQYFAYLTKDDCLALIDRCKQVLADHSLAGKLLPTQSGCLFGSTDYDEWYYKDVEAVLKTFEKLLPTYDEPAYPDSKDDPELNKYRCAVYIIFSW